MYSLAASNRDRWDWRVALNEHICRHIVLVPRGEVNWAVAPSKYFFEKYDQFFNLTSLLAEIGEISLFYTNHPQKQFLSAVLGQWKYRRFDEQVHNKCFWMITRTDTNKEGCVHLCVLQKPIYLIRKWIDSLDFIQLLDRDSICKLCTNDISRRQLGINYCLLLCDWNFWI